MTSKTYRKFFVFALLLGFLLSSCATRSSRTARPPMRPLSQEEVDARRMGASLDNVEAQERWKMALNLECPNGGRENVVISQRLGSNAFRVNGNGIARFLLARYMGLVEVTNPYNETVNINEGGRAMVHNMCPNGTITLVAVLGWDAGILGGSNSYSSEEFVWTARRYVGGHQYYGVSQYLSLYVYQWQRERKVQWLMKIEDVDRPLPAHTSSR